ncbi:excinuclease ABC subunit UvrB, partial [bacterium]|nr:excinuclease ABC subunit UvrB [bacterium]
MFKIQSKYKPTEDQQKAITSLVTGIKEGHGKQVLQGVTGSGKTFIMANVIQQLDKPTIIISHNKTLAAQLYEEFLDFFPDNSVKYFVSYYDYYQPEAYIPAKDLYIEKESDINKQIENLRFGAMNSAVTRRDTIVISSVSCIYNIGEPGNYENKAISFFIGQNIEISKVAEELVSMRYERDTYDFTNGVFRIAGDVIEIFPPYDDVAIRVELWGNTVERINKIHPITRSKLSDEKEILVFPATSLVYSSDVIHKAITNIEKDLKTRVDFLKNIHKDLEAHRLEQKTRYDIEMLKEVGYCKSMENYSIYFDGRHPGQPPYTLLDYFPKDYLMFIDESHITVPQIGGMYNGDKARKDNLIEYGFRLPTARDNRPLTYKEFKAKQGTTVYFSATPAELEIEDSNNHIVELLTRPTGLLDPEISIRPTEGQIDDVITEITNNVKKGQRVLVTTLTKRMAEDLTSYLQDADIKVQYIHSDVDTVERVDILRDLRLGKYDVLVGINLLREGIDLPEVSLVIILDADKEGFLRSKTSLIQTIGRAARHVEGSVIMYADSITESMKYAIDETNRRRDYQIQYNMKHNITPTSIQKEIRGRLVEDDDYDTDKVNREMEKMDIKQKKMMIK